MGEVIEVGGMAMVVRRPANDVLPVCDRHWVAVSAMMKAGARQVGVGLSGHGWRMGFTVGDAIGQCHGISRRRKVLFLMCSIRAKPIELIVVEPG